MLLFLVLVLCCSSCSLLLIAAHFGGYGCNSVISSFSFASRYLLFHHKVVINIVLTPLSLLFLFPLSSLLPQESFDSTINEQALRSAEAPSSIRVLKALMKDVGLDILKGLVPVQDDYSKLPKEEKKIKGALGCCCC